MTKKVNVEIYGNGGETTHFKVSKEAYKFWKEIDTDLLMEYFNAYDGDDFGLDVPKEADFLTDKDGVKKNYDEVDNIGQYHLALFDQVFIDVQIDGISYIEHDENNNPPMVGPITFSEDDEEDYEDDEKDGHYANLNGDFVEAELGILKSKAEYIITFYVSHKGCFITNNFEVEGEFDSKLLSIHYTETWEDQDVITGTFYDGKELNNEGGISEGRYNEAHVWQFEDKWLSNSKTYLKAAE